MELKPLELLCTVVNETEPEGASGSPWLLTQVNILGKVHRGAPHWSKWSPWLLTQVSGVKLTEMRHTGVNGAPRLLTLVRDVEPTSTPYLVFGQTSPWRDDVALAPGG